MTLRHLHVFLTVCTQGSMTKAAEVLNIAQPPVSQAIAELERHYGTLLFERRGRRLILTVAGNRLKTYATHIAALVSEVKTDLQDLEERGHLRVGASKTVGTELLPSVCHRFREVYPRSELDLVVDSTAVILQRLRAAEVDLALVEGVVDDPHLFHEPLCDDEMVLICSPEHRWSQQKSIVCSDLAGEAFLVREPGSGTRETFESTMASHGLPWTRAGEIGGGAAILALVAANLGVAFLSRRTVRMALARGQVRMVAVEGLEMTRVFRLVVHENKQMSPALVVFTKLAHEIALGDSP